MITRKKSTSVLNNSYKNCDALKGNDFEFNDSISLDEIESSLFMSDSFDIDSMEYTKTVGIVNDLLKNNEELNNLTKNENIKYSRSEIDYIFITIYNHFLHNSEYRTFMVMSYIFNIICNLTCVSHSVLFDMLSYTNKSIVLDVFSSEYDENLTDNIKFIF